MPSYTVKLVSPIEKEIQARTREEAEEVFLEDLPNEAEFETELSIDQYTDQQELQDRERRF